MPTQAAPKVSASLLKQLVDQVETVIYGKREAVTLAVVGLLAEGHVLLEDVPGTGKTTLARALARSVGGTFQRVQFTSDMLPSDVLGVSIWSQEQEAFRFTPGPIFHHIVLADELNRTSPRTQSSLLQCMAEGRVSMDGVTRDLPRPFFVIATQNPMEFEGTYPLPESQLDRFLLRIGLGHPDRDSERRVLETRSQGDPLDRLEPVMGLEELGVLIRAVKRVRVEESLVEYVLDLVAATRRSPKLSLGASTRATLGLQRSMQALALVEGRNYCVPDDVKRLFLPVVTHRVLAAPMRTGTAAGPEEVLAGILESVPVPR